MQVGERDDVAQFFASVFPLGFIGDLVDEEVLLYFVAIGVEQNAFAGQTVAAGSSGLLVVSFQGLGQIVVDHKANIRLVDPHSERDGRNDHGRVATHKLVLRCIADGAVQPGMVWQSLDAARG